LYLKEFILKVKIDSFLEDLIPGYLEGRKKDIVDIIAAIGREDYSLIEKITHKMAGNLGSYGFKELGLIAKELENLSIAKENIEKISVLMNKFEANFSDLEIEYI
jgi:HPt (histidine-containing phosphotransfer) domain-containing protein